MDRTEYKISWFSGTGPGGQKRNKTQNCCRLVHIATGIKAQGTKGRSREENQRKALEVLESRIKAYFYVQKERRTDTETVRTYHAVRNEVKDHASGFKQTYKHVVIDCNIEEMIKSRRMAIVEKS